MSRASIRWDEVHARLRTSEAALLDVLSENPARTEAVFRKRAERLASERIETGPVTRSIQALVFRLGQERYALELEHLAAVLPYNGCTRVPGAARELLGVINLRGELRPVVDLGRVLCGASADGTGFVLISRRQTALKVEEVEDLREIRRNELTPSLQSRYVQGIAPGPVLLLDIETLESAALSPKES